MKKNQVHRVVIHRAGENAEAFAEKSATFHVEVIERRLNRSELTGKEKIAVIDKILENIKFQEGCGVRK